MGARRLHLYYPNSYTVFRKEVFDQYPADRDGIGIKPFYVIGWARRDLKIRSKTG